MKVSVTGASGFIGGALVPLLAGRGHDARSSTRAEARDKTAFRGCDAVVHLANIAHARAPEAELQRVNVEETLQRARDAAASGVRRFVYLSSSLATDSTDAYGRSKLAAEQQLAALRDIEIVILRPPLVYGPRVKANFLALMRAVARGIPLPLASIDNRRSMVYVANLVDAILFCLETPKAAGRTLGVTDGEPVSIPQLCRGLGEALGRPARLFPCPPALLEVVPSLRKLTRSLVVDDSALRSELGWRPPHTMAEGLRETARWYRDL